MSDLGLLGGEPVRNTPFPRYPILGDAEVEAVSAAVRTQDLSAEFGATAAAFEREFAKFCGARYAVATSSGTTALHAALAAAGIGVGDEVIVPPYAFLSTATCPSFLTGALPDPLYLDLFVRHAVEAVVEAQERHRGLCRGGAGAGAGNGGTAAVLRGGVRRRDVARRHTAAGRGRRAGAAHRRRPGEIARASLAGSTPAARGRGGHGERSAGNTRPLLGGVDFLPRWLSWGR